MSEPRWTEGTNSSLMWWAQGDERGPSLHQRDLGAIWDALPYDDVNDAYDALVAAVRDAELLRQARDYIRSFATGVPAGMTPTDIVKQLTDLICWGITPPLLAPVSGTPTPGDTQTEETT